MLCFSKLTTKCKLTANRHIEIAPEQNTTILCVWRTKIGVDDNELSTLWALVGMIK